jgi:hypothetical protein
MPRFFVGLIQMTLSPEHRPHCNKYDYGEGECAFRRLREEIMRISDNESIFV